MKGIVLAGGSGSRLWNITKGVSKQMLPIYDKPMIMYPLSVLMLADIKDILIITTAEDQNNFKRLLGNGEDYGINISYAIQYKPNGLAEAFLIAENYGFAKEGEELALVLGDNLFYGGGFSSLLKEAKLNIINDATIFGYWVSDPQRYGVAEFNKKGECISIEEKPENPKSNYAVVGLYFYPWDVIQKAKKVVPSKRGELEITTLNQMYLEERRLKIEKLPRGFSWFDTGTFDSLMEASNYVQTIEKRQGLQIACLEEIAYDKGWITYEQLQDIGNRLQKNSYGQYLLNLK